MSTRALSSFSFLRQRGNRYVKYYYNFYLQPPTPPTTIHARWWMQIIEFIPACTIVSLPLYLYFVRPSEHGLISFVKPTWLMLWLGYGLLFRSLCQIAPTYSISSEEWKSTWIKEIDEKITHLLQRMRKYHIVNATIPLSFWFYVVCYDCWWYYIFSHLFCWPHTRNVIMA